MDKRKQSNTDNMVIERQEEIAIRQSYERYKEISDNELYVRIQKELEERANQQLQNIDKEIVRQTYNDMLIYGECMVHIDENGKESRIEPYSEEYYTVKEKQSKPNNMVTEEQSLEIDWEKSCIAALEEYMMQTRRVRELEEQIVTYCRENPAAEEWFQITVKRD
jgi:hypothetical protein